MPPAVPIASVPAMARACRPQPLHRCGEEGDSVMRRIRRPHERFCILRVTCLSAAIRQHYADGAENDLQRPVL
jgi:hypothetical protein